ncbi:hypothetical protein WDW37_12875 [Bdellovibrionota bacterium FG-1]
MKNLITVLALVFVFAPSMSFAKPQQMTAFKAAYPATKLSVNCKVCHTSGSQLNGYGIDLQKTKAGDKFDFKAIEALDSDGDGVSTIDEINAGTNPGDKNSH